MHLEPTSWLLVKLPKTSLAVPLTKPNIETEMQFRCFVYCLPQAGVHASSTSVR